MWIDFGTQKSKSHSSLQVQSANNKKTFLWLVNSESILLKMVYCELFIIPLLDVSIAMGVCEDGDVRLVGSTRKTQYEGRVILTKFGALCVALDISHGCLLTITGEHQILIWYADNLGT